MSVHAALTHTNVQAFLALIRAGEGTSDADGYRRMFGGQLLDTLDDHPRRPVTATLGGLPITSTAAGAYQFLSRTWDECARALGLADFSPACQDQAALYLIERRGALQDVIDGHVEQAIAKCAKEWASLPGSPYGQPTRTLAQALQVYFKAGGSRTEGSIWPTPAAPPAPTPAPTPAPLPATPLPPTPAPQPAAPHVPAESSASAPYVAPAPAPTAQPTPPKEARPMLPFIAAALPMLIEAIPKLGQLFGSGSQVAERNVKAAELAVQLVQQAVGAPNAQSAVEAIKADPTALQKAEKTIQDNWFVLTESGGGGIDGARKADLEFVQRHEPVWRSPSFLIAMAITPLVYLIVLSLIGLVGTTQWSDDVRAALAGSIVSAVIGGLVGYYFGQTTSRNRTPAA